MTVNIYKNEIYEVEDFLTPQEQEFYLSIIRNSTEKDWPDHLTANGRTTRESWENRLMLVVDTENPMHKNIRTKIENIFENFSRISSANLIHRYQKGEDKGEHRDDSGDINIQYGIVIYLNDNYMGGEIVYSDYNLSIKPKARSLLVHPGYLNHFVNPVESEETRYVLTAFVFKTNNQEVVIKKNLGMELGKIYD